MPFFDFPATFISLKGLFHIDAIYNTSSLHSSPALSLDNGNYGDYHARNDRD
jgi:hypothetical protein